VKDKFTTVEQAGAVVNRTRGLVDPLRPFCTTKEVEVIVRDRKGRVKFRGVTNFETKGGAPNLRVNGGADFWNLQLFATSGAAGNQANWIGITTDSVAPAATDTALATEETANGLARKQATVTHVAAAGSTLLSATWTYSGSSTKVIAKVGLFNAAGPPVAGTLVLETLLAATATLNSNGDQLTVNWTVSF